MADALVFYHTVSPQVGYGWGSKPSKHDYSFDYDLRYITQCSTGKDTDLKYKLGPQWGENIQKLADASSFCLTTRLQVGSGWGSKPPKYPYYFKYDLKYITEYLTGM